MRQTLSLAHQFLLNAFGISLSLARGPRGRVLLILSGVLIVLFTAIWVHAQTGLDTSSKTQKECAVWKSVTANTRVEVRSGGSVGKSSFVTSYLNPGDKVLVLRESKRFPGWLEIKPPAGSYSWISSLVVKRYGKFVGAVKAIDPVPTRIGQAVRQSNEIPKTENARKLARGTLLVVLADKAVSTKEGSWLPIAPTPEEVRYIPATAVQDSRAEPVSVASADGTRLLIEQADRAFQAGQWSQATSRYLQAAQSTQDYNNKLYCYNQLDILDRQGGGRLQNQATPGHPQHASTAQRNHPFQTTSNASSGYRPSPIQQKKSTVHTTLSPSAPHWSRWGVLRTTRFRHQGHPMYVLTDGRGNVITYAATTPDMTLQPYLNRQVCLFGTTRYQSDDRSFRNHFMVVSHVAVP